MTDEKVQLIIGGLLHDIGKVIYRQGDGRRHSISGYDFLKNEVSGITEKNVLDSVRYHHGKELRGASLEKNSFAYITYIADNIAASVDRRKKETEDIGFEMTAPLEPVFNILNQNDGHYYYHPAMLGENDGINMPTTTKTPFHSSFYKEVVANLKDNLKGISWNEQYIHSLLTVLEANFSYIPSSTSREELADISLYDHVKLTAAFNSCIYDYLEEAQIDNYKVTLFEHSDMFYRTKAFRLLSMDISGIQDFIYTIHSKGALKMLRARSFYLEMMMEHVIDVLLERCEQSRANLLYAGGGHCYIILPNTENIVREIDRFEMELNQWLLDQFQTDLFVAVGSVPCSANDLRNIPKGSYEPLYEDLGALLAKKKSRRYSAEQIRTLNKGFSGDHSRECKVCKRLGKLNEDNECPMCSKLRKLSGHVLHTDFFIVSEEEQADGLPLPFDMFLYAESEASLKERMAAGFLHGRVYSINTPFTGMQMTTNLLVGTYSTGETFEELANQADGIKRIGILRADVDNLGTAFVSGFKNEKNEDQNVTISRTATLSRQLSLFFKYHLNHILKSGTFSLDSKKEGERKAAIVYSGGDDLFIVGAWNDVIELGVDIRDKFKEYTENTLTLSGGIGIYQPGYPIHVSSFEVQDLEEEAKHLPGKAAITLLPDGENHVIKADGMEYEIGDGTYSWKQFKEKVLLEKYRVIESFFESSEDRGKSFLYNLLELIRKQDDKMNLARYVYLLARMEPNAKASPAEKERYKEFSRKMYEWIHSTEDCRQLKTAITLYTYLIRGRDDNENNQSK